MISHYDSPRQAVMALPGYPDDELEDIAERAASFAYEYLPRVTSASAATVQPIFGEGWFGVKWDAESIWFQEQGIKPFTMHSLAGKTIPMWVKDPDMKLRTENPEIKTRVREDNGETEVLIFRRAARHGERKDELRLVDGLLQYVNVPRSYPGAPGRISKRAGGPPNPGWIAKGNVGVRWRHPGLSAGENIVRALSDAASEAGAPVGEVQYLPMNTMLNGDPYDILVLRD